MSLVRVDLSGHDRAPATLDREPSAALANALARLRVQGAFFLRGEYSEAWAFESMPAGDVAAAMMVDAERVLLFHVIGSGRCWVEPAAGQRLWAEAGDVIVLPYGDAHRMGGVADATCVPAHPDKRCTCSARRTVRWIAPFWNSATGSW